MNISRAIVAQIAEQYEQQKDNDSEIVLIPNEGNTGGHCNQRLFKKDKLYKIVFPVPLASLDHYMAVQFSTNENGKFHSISTSEQYNVVSIYDEHSVNFCFFKFLRDIECSFYTNLH